MEEGQLKKRIQHDTCIVLKGVPLSIDELNETTVYDPVYTHFETVKTAIDDARKEFPHIHELPNGTFIYDAPEGEQWFKKWFGIEKEKTKP